MKPTELSNKEGVIFLKIKIIGIILVQETIQASCVQLNKTSCAHCILNKKGVLKL